MFFSFLSSNPVGRGTTQMDFVKYDAPPTTSHPIDDNVDCDCRLDRPPRKPAEE